jgi:oxygen-independent coproporphyrinogen III oxidase
MPRITQELIQTFDVPGPRYTSYPTADRFVDAFQAEDYIRALSLRQSGMMRSATPLSLYIHIPFCESLCYYCACNKIVTKHHNRSSQYLQYLSREIALTIKHLGSQQAVSQLHLGGGTPTFFTDAELIELLAMLRSQFTFSPTGEYAIEVDPRTVNTTRIQALADMGFNRLSFGVQDFDAAVQKTVHRVQPFEQVKTLMEDARRIGFHSLNMDLIYGLPLQTSESFDRTIEQVISLRPDRIALYGYAHLPERFKPQRRIQDSELPSANAKVSMLEHSILAFESAGYIYVGMDHFALPTDSLAIAKRQGRLHRNFQGYSTQPDCDLISLGVSAIGKVGATYSQNEKTLEAYCDALDQGRLPIMKGLALNQDDVLRRSVVMTIMCQGRLDFEAIEQSHLIQFKQVFAKELKLLTELEGKGLLILTETSLEVTEMGWYFVRGIAMVFDRYLQADKTRATFSKII